MNPASVNLSPTPLAVALGSTLSYTASLSIGSYSGDFVAVGYATLPGNQPKSRGNTLHIWEATAIPWESQPLSSIAIDSNGQDGQATFSGLTISALPYIIGYAPSPDPTKICATAQLYAGGSVTAPSAVQIGVANIGTTWVTVRYTTLFGYRPNKYGNWVGIWQSEVSPYNATPPLRGVAVPDLQEGTVTLDNLSIAVRTTYTVIYFMGELGTPGPYKTAAAILAFDTTAPALPEARKILPQFDRTT